ncbi:MAG: DUF2079 domain-containing protein [Myxococcaceae bacterium]
MSLQEPRTDSNTRRIVIAYLLATGAFMLLSVPLSYAHPELGAFRNWQTALSPLLLVALLWRGDLAALGRVDVPRRLVLAFGASTLAWCIGLQLSRYGSFAINGVDFSIFDWMLYNTNHRQFMYSPIYAVNHFGVHPSYVLLPLVPLHRLFETPLMLVMVTALSVWAAVIPLWKLTQRLLGNGAWPVLVSLAYLTCPWVAVLLDGGFRPEVLYPVFGLTFALGWVERRARLWIPAVVLFLAIKEDAAFYVTAVAAGVLVFERSRWRAGLGLLVGSLSLLALNIGVVQPLALEGSTMRQPGYLHFWGHLGGSLPEILGSMVRAPHRIALDVLQSGWWRMLLPLLLLPFASRLPLMGMLPTLFLLGSASYGMMRNFKTYYPVTLVPFVLWGLLEAWRNVERLKLRGRVRDAVFVVAVLTFPLVGGGYAKSAPPDFALLAQTRALGERLSSHQGAVCTQTALFPHLPYSLDLQPLFEEGCLDRPGAVAVVNLSLNPYPLGTERLEAFARSARAEAFGDGFLLLYPNAPGIEGQAGPLTP